MATSIMIHSATDVRASSVQHSNNNAVSIVISTKEGSFDITLFDLSRDAADYLASALAPEWTRKSEDEIRADERRKIAAGLGLAA